MRFIQGQMSRRMGKRRVKQQNQIHHVKGGTEEEEGEGSRGKKDEQEGDDGESAKDEGFEQPKTVTVRKGRKK